MYKCLEVLRRLPWQMFLLSPQLLLEELNTIALSPTSFEPPPHQMESIPTLSITLPDETQNDTASTYTKPEPEKAVSLTRSNATKNTEDDAFNRPKSTKAPSESSL